MESAVSKEQALNEVAVARLLIAAQMVDNAYVPGIYDNLADSATLALCVIEMRAALKGLHGAVSEESLEAAKEVIGKGAEIEPVLCIEEGGIVHAYGMTNGILCQEMLPISNPLRLFKAHPDCLDCIQYMLKGEVAE